MNNLFAGDLELRKTPAKYIFGLAQILEIGQGWKELMAIIPNLDSRPQLKYTVEQMRTVEEASAHGTRTCSEILLDEWGTSGRARPRLNDLLHLLKAAQLYRAAEYVSFNLLNESLVERPADGPAARVDIPSDENHVGAQPSAPPLSTDDSSNCQLGTTVETSDCLATRRVCPPTVQRAVLEGAASNVRIFTYQQLLEGTNSFDEASILGRGGFSRVYLWRTLGAAVKRLSPPDQTPAPPSLTGSQFANELAIVSELSHPHILQLLGYSSDGPELCLVYPLMANGSLQDRLEREPKLSWDNRLHIAIQVADGLSYLHSQSPKPLVHRDVKSANVLLDHDYTAKISDFGFMKYGPSGGKSQSVALTSTVLGTTVYMAPEAFRGDVSAKMDVFSFGVVLLELLTGLPPYDEARSGCDLASHVDELDDFDLLVDRTMGFTDEQPLRRTFDLARVCLHEKKWLRPSALHALQLLSRLGRLPPSGPAHSQPAPLTDQQQQA